MKYAMKSPVAAGLLFACLCLIPALAQEGSYEYEPVPFNQSLELARGVLSPIAEGGLYLNEKDACQLVISEWGWNRAQCRSVDRIVITPNETLDSLTTVLDSHSKTESDQRLDRNCSPRCV